MTLLKLRKFIFKDSLARARKRVKTSIKLEAKAMIYRNIFKEGMQGYLRDSIYE